jgi:hypothetical protein
MARARRRSRRRRRRPASPAPTVAAATIGAEQHLLALARELTAIPSRTADPGAALAAAIEHLAGAWVADGPLAAVAFDAWRTARADKTRALALAFAREQIILGLQEILEATTKGGTLSPELGPDALAWVVNAGCESLAHGGDSAERIRVLLALCAPRDAPRP